LTLGVTPREVMELDNIESTKKMVERKLGIALLPRSAVAGELAGKSLVEVSVTDAPSVTQKIVLIRRRDQGRPSGTVAAFLNMVREADPTALAS
jgi:DNA-binding transcriptional LysR family regulator